MTREEAIANLEDILEESTRHEDSVCYVTGEDAETLKIAISALQQVVKDTNVPCTDTISRQAAIRIFTQLWDCIGTIMDRDEWGDICKTTANELPSAQPERKCVNCGRTANNGGWYEDGRTRCPIEEHYALPKDGYCHLWEKRKDWEDNYVKRSEEGEK